MNNHPDSPIEKISNNHGNSIINLISRIPEKGTFSKDVWKIKADSNLFFIDFKNEKIIIDTGSRKNRRIVKDYLSKLVDFNKITKVIFTHMHYDHIGNFDLFPNAEFFASKRELKCFDENPFGTVLDEGIVDRVKYIEIKPIENIKSELDLFEIIDTPGHTKGSICIWYPEKRILFSGDTLLKKGYGRTDLPTSVPEELKKSLGKLIKYNYKYLATGHEY